MSKIDDLRGKLAERKGKSADTVLRASSAENPLSQEEILKYAKENGGMLFDVEKVGIPVDLTKAVGGEKEKNKTENIRQENRREGKAQMDIIPSAFT